MEKRLMTFIAGVALSMGSALAQTSISGTVVSNEDEEPVIGASIRLDGTKTGTVTDVDGNFSLVVPNKNSVLEISYLGMRTVKVKAVNGMKVVLISDAKNLDDVVVTAQGLKRQKRSLGYATQEIKAADLTSVGQQGLNNALAVRLLVLVSSVALVQNSTKEKLCSVVQPLCHQTMEQLLELQQVQVLFM